jgi:hypothetical protein
LYGWRTSDIGKKTQYTDGQEIITMADAQQEPENYTNGEEQVLLIENDKFYRDLSKQILQKIGVVERSLFYVHLQPLQPGLINYSNTVFYKATFLDNNKVPLYSVFVKDEENVSDEEPTAPEISKKRKNHGQYEKAQLEFAENREFSTPRFIHYAQTAPSSFKLAMEYIDGINADKLFFYSKDTKDSVQQQYLIALKEQILKQLSGVYVHGKRHIDDLLSSKMLMTNIGGNQTSTIDVQRFYDMFKYIYAVKNKVPFDSKKYEVMDEAFAKYLIPLLDNIREIVPDRLLEKQPKLLDRVLYYTLGDTAPHNILVNASDENALLQPPKPVFIDLGHARRRPWQFDSAKFLLSHIFNHHFDLDSFYTANREIQKNIINTEFALDNRARWPIDNFQELNDSEKFIFYRLVKYGGFFELFRRMANASYHQLVNTQSYERLMQRTEIVNMFGKPITVAYGDMYTNARVLGINGHKLDVFLDDIVENSTEFSDTETASWVELHNIFKDVGICGDQSV